MADDLLPLLLLGVVINPTSPARRTLPWAAEISDPQSSWNGYSTGKWDDDTLLVESNGFREGIWLERRESPLTEAAKITEHFRRINYGQLEIDVTIDDLKAYNKPWTVKLAQTIVVDTDFLETYCAENERDPPHYVR